MSSNFRSQSTNTKYTSVNVQKNLVQLVAKKKMKKEKAEVKKKNKRRKAEREKMEGWMKLKIVNLAFTPMRMRVRKKKEVRVKERQQR